MKKEFIPYLLPIVTIIALFILASVNPGITGFSVKELNDKVTANVAIYTDNNIVLPKDAVIEVWLDDKKSSLSIEEFIKKNGGWFEIKNGSYPLINYIGGGYSGDHKYILDLDSFNLGLVESRVIHVLKLKVYYKDKIISETTHEIKK